MQTIHVHINVVVVVVEYITHNGMDTRKKNLKKQQQQQWKEYVEFQKNAGGNFDGGHGEHTLTRII